MPRCPSPCRNASRSLKRWSDVAEDMTREAKRLGVTLVRKFVGHGIGREMHEAPQVPNFMDRDMRRSDFELKPGLVLAIEPMVNAGRASVKVQSDGWTAVTTDGSLSAHFEHTVVVTREGTEILTLLAEDAERARQVLPART